MSEHDDLTNLSTHPGWLRLCEYARRTWSEKHEQHVRQAADERDDTMALNKLRQVIAARAAVEVLLGWPAERLRTLEAVVAADHAPQTQSRRGML